jgi:hypothetical protein
MVSHHCLYEGAGREMPISRVRPSPSLFLSPYFFCRLPSSPACPACATYAQFISSCTQYNKTVSEQHVIQAGPVFLKFEAKKKNYAGEKPFPTLFKGKEPLWYRVLYNSSTMCEATPGACSCKKQLRIPHTNAH